MCFPFSLVDKYLPTRGHFFFIQGEITLFLFFFIQVFRPKKKTLPVDIFMRWLVKWEKGHSSRKY